MYNSIFEPVYGHSISLEVTDEQGKKRNYSYTTSPGNSRYQIGDLTEGVYRYRARTTLEQKQEEVRGEFAVVKRQTELQNLTAEFDLLKALSRNMEVRLQRFECGCTKRNCKRLRQRRSSIRRELRHAINTKWVFLVLLCSPLEWTFRSIWSY